jgi:hypothetical protein
MRKTEYKVAHALVRHDGSLIYSVFATFDTKPDALSWIEGEGRTDDPAICIVKVTNKVVWRPSPADVAP